jgi:hypothetical protein
MQAVSGTWVEQQLPSWWPNGPGRIRATPAYTLQDRLRHVVRCLLPTQDIVCSGTRDVPVCHGVIDEMLVAAASVTGIREDLTSSTADAMRLFSAVFIIALHVMAAFLSSQCVPSAAVLTAGLVAAAGVCLGLQRCAQQQSRRHTSFTSC